MILNHYLKHKYFLIIITCFLANHSILFPQILHDQILSDSVNRGNICLDDNSDIHLIFQSNYDDGFINYGKYDSLGGEIILPYKISSTSWNNSPVLTIQNGILASAWTQQSWSFSSYINGHLASIDGSTIKSFIEYNDVYGEAGRINPDLTFLNESNYIVVWGGNGIESPFDYQIFSQIVDTTGQSLGNNTLLSDALEPYIDCNNPNVSSLLSSERFVVGWSDNRDGTQRLYGRIFLKDGIPVDSSFLISMDEGKVPIASVDVEMVTEDTVIFTYGAEIDNNVYDIYLRYFDIYGNPIRESIVVNNSPTHTLPLVSTTIDNNGNIVVLWCQKLDPNIEIRPIYISGQRFSKAGTKIGENFNISSHENQNDQLFPSPIIKDNILYVSWQEDYYLWLSILNLKELHGSIKPKHKRKSKNYNLLQNFPNPFNSTTVIDFTIPISEKVEISIYNISGQKVSTILNQKLYAGDYSLEFNATNLASGIYFYQIVTGKFRDVKKMVVTK